MAMRIIVVTFLLIIIFLHFDLTYQWVKFHLLSWNKLYNIQKNSTIEACQIITAKKIEEIEKITEKVNLQSSKLFRAYGGIGLYPQCGKFYYIEIYSEVEFFKNSDSFFDPRKYSRSYVGDCICANSECSYFQAVCIYTYWLGWYVYGTHPMCNVNPFDAFQSTYWYYR